MVTAPTPERRELDRTQPAFVVHYEGGFAVWDTQKHVGPMSLADANVRAYVHNTANGHPTHPILLRVNV